ncbi:MAG: hypothetical protein M3O62_08745 [Pseudomonadota bacterium]|nr:hypothetical protein [Pseudomonadota bacterium]
MTRSIRKVAAVASMLAALLAGGVHAAERPAAATIMLLAGQANASDSQTMAMRVLAKGDTLYPGEVISSGANTYVNLRFNDGGFILLRPNTRFVIEEFAADAETLAAAAAPKEEPAPAKAAATAAPLRPIPNARTPSEPTAQRAFFRLLKGGFRAVSGLIGKADQAEYRVNTPVATIGIRGTDYWVVLCDEACAADKSLKEGLPEGASGLNGVIMGVISGGIFTTNGAGVSVGVNVTQFLITLPDGTQIFLPVAPEFLRLDPIPDPTTICDKDA